MGCKPSASDPSAEMIASQWSMYLKRVELKAINLGI